MKRRLRAKVIDRQGEKFVKRCRECILIAQPNKPTAMYRHRFPEGPWQCIAIDRGRYRIKPNYWQ